MDREIDNALYDRVYDLDLFFSRRCETMHIVPRGRLSWQIDDRLQIRAATREHGRNTDCRFWLFPKKALRKKQRRRRKRL